MITPFPHSPTVAHKIHLETVRENGTWCHGAFPEDTEKEYSRPLSLTACIFPVGWNLVPLHGSTDQFCKEHDFRLYRFMQIGTYGFIIVVDIVAIPVDVAIVIYIGCVITIVTRRPEPPDAYNQIPR